jgi:hypothetical protein
MGFLNSQKQCWVLPVDGIVKFNGPLGKFPVNRAFWIIQGQILQLLLFICSLSSSLTHPVSHSESTDSSKSLFKSGQSRSELSYKISSSVPSSVFVMQHLLNDCCTVILSKWLRPIL